MRKKWNTLHVFKSIVEANCNKELVSIHWKWLRSAEKVAQWAPVMRFRTQAPQQFSPSTTHTESCLAIVWWFYHMDSGARFCMRSEEGKSLWCPSSKSQHWWTLSLLWLLWLVSILRSSEYL